MVKEEEEESNRNGNSKKDIDLSEHISERLRKIALSEGSPRNGREGSCSGSSDYTALTLSSIENRYSNQTQQNKSVYTQNKDIRTYNNNEMLETSSDQIP